MLSSLIFRTSLSPFGGEVPFCPPLLLLLLLLLLPLLFPPLARESTSSPFPPSTAMVFQSLEVGGVYVSGDIHAIKAGGIKLLDGRVALTDGGGQVVQIL